MAGKVSFPQVAAAAITPQTSELDAVHKSDEYAHLLSPPGHPYDPAELQRSFSAMSARDVYTLLCRRCGCKPVSSVLSLLPERPGEWQSVTELDLSRTYIGPRGVVPVMELCKLLPQLHTLSLVQNYLSNHSVWHVCKVLVYHPSIQRIELGGNDISWTAGMCILELVSRNSNVVRVGVNDTLIYPNVQSTITAQLRRNMLSGARGHRRGPQPSNHPTTIRLRALKRFFRDALSKEATEAANTAAATGGANFGEGRLHKTVVLEGLKELYKLTGREQELQHRSPAFFERYLRRVSTETVDWETFALIVLCEDVTVNSEAVEDLRHVFAHFDADRQGYVGFAELKDMMSMLRKGYEPTADEVEAKMKEFDADETMTLNWDEFLLLMYDKGPHVGELCTFHVHTPMRHRKAEHY